MEAPTRFVAALGKAPTMVLEIVATKPLHPSNSSRGSTTSAVTNSATNTPTTSTTTTIPSSTTCTSTNSSFQFSHVVAIGAGVGVPVVVALLLGLWSLFYREHERRARLERLLENILPQGTHTQTSQSAAVSYVAQEVGRSDGDELNTDPIYEANANPVYEANGSH